MEISSRYRLEPYGLVHPLQVREVMKTSRDCATVKLHQSGWALLVAKTKIYLWRYIGKSQICKELVVPSSDAIEQLNSDLVCFYPSPPSINTTSFPRHIGLVAVSPSGVAFCWNNILQHDKAKGYVEKLIVEGGGAHSLQCIPEVGCLLATKDCRYFIITLLVHQGQSSLTVQQLSAGGMISGFARRFSSVWFQSSSVAKILRKVVVSSTMDGKCVYILTDARVEKWSIGSSHQQVYDVSLEPLLAERLASYVTAEDNDILVEYIDMKVINDHLVILFAMVNTPKEIQHDDDNISTNKMATLATIVLSADTRSPRLLQMVVINSGVTYQEDEELFKWCLVHEMCCHNSESVLSVEGSHYDRLEVRQDKLLGSGHFEESHLLFLAKTGVMKLQLKSMEVPKYKPVALKKVKKQSVRRSLLPQEMPSDDYLNVLKKAFQHYCEENLDEACLLLQQQFFPSFAHSQESGTFGDVATFEISSLLLDDVPDADPRWAEDLSQESDNTNTVILYQLEDKLIAHERLMRFIIDMGIMARLMVVTVHGRRMKTTDYLSEHAEKLVIAMAMTRLPYETFEGAIKLVLASRGVVSKPNLTPEDLFYREVSCIDEILKALLDDQEEKCHCLTDDSRIRLVATVLSAFESIVRKACQHRHNKYSFYHPDTTAVVDVEFIPWTATDCVRRLATRQLDIVVGMGIQESTYQHKQLLWQSFVDLVDVILNGYCEQITSIRDLDKRKDVECLYEGERAHLLQLLTKLGLSSYVISLAEKYQDFPTLMSVCECTADPRGSVMLHEYMTHFASEGFAKFVFQKYKEQGRIKELMSAPPACYQQLEEFLSPYDELRWMHEMHTRQYHSAYSTLLVCADREQKSLAKQKNCLSISKLSLLASDCSVEEKQAELEELELKLRLIDYQENLIKDCTKVEDLFMPLSPDQLIEGYTSNDFTNSAILDNFLCALEILSVFYPDRHAQNFHHQRLLISSQAILRNDWEQIPVDDPINTLKIVFFFQLSQAALDKGLDVLQLLPSLQELLLCDALQEVNQLSSFIILMNAGYEQLDRVTNIGH